MLYSLQHIAIILSMTEPAKNGKGELSFVALQTRVSFSGLAMMRML